MNQDTFSRVRDRVHFAYPCRPWQLIKIDAGFLDESYKREFGKWHRGIDLNGIGGGDTDLGFPVQSMFPGDVVDVNNRSQSYGNTVMVRAEPWVRDFVAHALGRDLQVLDVVYSHLHQVSVTQGDRVNAGDHVGSIGKGGANQFPAHLHLEVRRLAVSSTFAQGSTDASRAEVLEQCLDPQELLRKLPLADYATTLPQRRLVAPIAHMVYNDSDIEGERVVVMNRSGGKLFLYDQRAVQVPPAPTSLVDAIRYGIELWKSSR
jgi:murein DD-endopeptidase MepM/ murein hydrolase activator NlpD